MNASTDNNQDTAADPAQDLANRLSGLEARIDGLASRYNAGKVTWSQDTFQGKSNNHRIAVLDEYMALLFGKGKIADSQPMGEIILPETSAWPAEGFFPLLVEALKDYSLKYAKHDHSDGGFAKEFYTPANLVEELDERITEFDGFFTSLGKIGYGLSGKIRISQKAKVMGESDAIAEALYFFTTGQSFNPAELPTISRGRFETGYIGSIESMLSWADKAMSGLKKYYAAKPKDDSRFDLGIALGTLASLIGLGVLAYFALGLNHSNPSPEPTQEPTALVAELPTEVPTEILPTPTPADVLIPLSIRCKGEQKFLDSPTVYACGNAVDGDINGSSYATSDFFFTNRGEIIDNRYQEQEIPDITLTLSSLIPIKDAELRLYWGRSGAFEYDITIFDSAAANLGTVRIAPGAPGELFPREVGYLDTHGAPFLDRLQLGNLFASLGSGALDRGLYSIVISPKITNQFFDAEDQSIHYGQDLVLYEAQVADISSK
jgi:hypothetical protein